MEEAVTESIIKSAGNKVMSQQDLSQKKNIVNVESYIKENQKMQSLKSEEQARNSKVQFFDGSDKHTSSAANNDQIEEEALAFRHFNMMEDKLLEEKNLKKHLELYYNQLDQSMRQSFAPVDSLIKQTFRGYDA